MRAAPTEPAWSPGSRLSWCVGKVLEAGGLSGPRLLYNCCPQRSAARGGVVAEGSCKCDAHLHAFLCKGCTSWHGEGDCVSSYLGKSCCHRALSAPAQGTAVASSGFDQPCSRFWVRVCTWHRLPRCARSWAVSAACSRLSPSCALIGVSKPGLVGSDDSVYCCRTRPSLTVRKQSKGSSVQSRPLVPLELSLLERYTLPCPPPPPAHPALLPTLPLLSAPAPYCLGCCRASKRTSELFARLYRRFCSAYSVL